MSIPIFVINLDRDIERLRSIDSQLRTHGIAYQRFSAIDKLSLNQEDRGHYSKFQALLSAARPLSDGEIACCLSHYAVWETIQKEQLELALILEDDVVIDERLRDILPKILGSKDSFDCLLLKTDRRAEPTGEEIAPGFRLTSFRKRPNRACAYVLTAKAADTLLQHRFPIRMPLDDLLGGFTIHNLCVRGLEPQVVDIKAVESSIWQSQKMPKRSRFFRKIRSMLRLVSNYY